MKIDKIGSVDKSGAVSSLGSIGKIGGETRKSAKAGKSLSKGVRLKIAHRLGKFFDDLTGEDEVDKDKFTAEHSESKEEKVKNLKVLLNPDVPYEYWKRIGSLLNQAVEVLPEDLKSSQLKITTENMEEIIQELEEILKLLNGDEGIYNFRITGRNLDIQI